MSREFICGFLFCMFADILYAIANSILQYAFKMRAEKKYYKSLMNDERDGINS